MLFHYHFWTPIVESMERFYHRLGFRVDQRIGRFEGKFQSFDPPLAWEDFKDKKILFRIIEMKKENINITFGYGKRTKFDHIGFLVSEEEKLLICQNAHVLNWKVELGERRSFISSPYGFSIELQTHRDTVDGDRVEENIMKMLISTLLEGLEENLNILFGREMKEVQSVKGEEVMLKEIGITFLEHLAQDPCGAVLKPAGK